MSYWARRAAEIRKLHRELMDKGVDIRGLWDGQDLKRLAEKERRGQPVPLLKWRRKKEGLA